MAIVLAREADSTIFDEPPETLRRDADAVIKCEGPAVFVPYHLPKMTVGQPVQIIHDAGRNLGIW